MKKIIYTVVLLLLTTPGKNVLGQADGNLKSGVSPEVVISGAMRNVMHKGELHGTIHLDTISNKRHLYGIGPIAYLKGEIMIYDGTCYSSRVLSDTTMSIEKTFDLQAPFFVYANVERWFETAMPDSIHSIGQLESFLEIITRNSPRPFAFKIDGSIGSADYHIVNLPDGKIVRSPADAHTNQKTYSIENTSAKIIGFFSTEHAGVFIHHDRLVHMHLLTSDEKGMGHIDHLVISNKNLKLYLPFKI